MNETTRRIVKKRVVKGFWNCKYCGTTKIDGLVDYCPNCGRHKPTGTKHGLDKNNIVEVSKEELAAAGIVHSEDGSKRPEWSCKYCDSLNNWLDDVCHSCGALRAKENNRLKYVC